MHDDGGDNPFWDAFDDVEVLKQLVASGARLSDVDVLLHAVSIGRTDLVDIFVSSNRDLLNAFDEDLSWTPLIQAANVGDVSMVQHLLDLGAEVDARDEFRHNETALHMAVNMGHYDVARLLIEYGADPTIKGGMGLTPLDRAKRRIRMPELYELLLNAREIASAAALYRAKSKPNKPG
jgi:ankyrin repeat protein